jgi:hypothetical protein
MYAIEKTSGFKGVELICRQEWHKVIDSGTFGSLL